MSLSSLLVKYLLLFSGFSSATIIPLAYSQRVRSNIVGGGQQGNSLNNQYLGEVNSSPGEEDTVKLRTKRSTFSQNDPEIVIFDRSPTNREEDLLSKPALFERYHELSKNYEKLVSTSQFREIYGTQGFKEEGNINIKGAENMTILDAWERFFRTDSLNHAGKEEPKTFFVENKDLIFGNYDFPYIAVEFPKEIRLPENLGGIKVNYNDLQGVEKYGEKISKRIRESSELFRKSQLSEDTTEDRTMDRFMYPSRESDLYIVLNPEQLLKIGLGNWNNNFTTPSREDSYSLFESAHYEKLNDQPEVFVLRRGGNGKQYRMGIHHKELKSGSIDLNKQEFGVGYYSQGSPKEFKLNLKGGKNFLLNLLIGYAYTYKLQEHQLSYSETRQKGGGNLINIYGDNRSNSDNFSKGIGDGYQGVGRKDGAYWWNLSITKGRIFNRIERVNGVGEMMDNLADSGGKLPKSKVLS